MDKAEFDPESTFFSLNVWSNSETCSKKVRYKGTSEAILALIRIEKRVGSLVKQLPYRCPNCRGVHNTHLISRSELARLILKYKERPNRDELKVTKSKIVNPTQNRKTYNLSKLLVDLQKLTHLHAGNQAGPTLVRIRDFEEYLIKIGYVSDTVADTLEKKILWLLFYTQSYKEYLQIQVASEVMFNSCMFTERKNSQEVTRNKLDDFEQRAIKKYLTDRQLFDGLHFIAEKCAALNENDWKKINQFAKLLSQESKHKKLPEFQLFERIEVDPGITKANINKQTNGDFDRVTAKYALISDIEEPKWKEVHVSLELLNDQIFSHSIQISGLDPNAEYQIIFSFTGVGGESIEMLETFRTGRLPDQQRRLPSDAGRNFWPSEALPPGGGAIRRRDGN
jgi:hypothetical protein